jgi:hypothetical protein
MLGRRSLEARSARRVRLVWSEHEPRCAPALLKIAAISEQMSVTCGSEPRPANLPYFPGFRVLEQAIGRGSTALVP